VTELAEVCARMATSRGPANRQACQPEP